jgi:MFS family permease
MTEQEMTTAGSAPKTGSWGAFEPLREATFRNIWLASVVANFGQLILGVGAAWEMTRLGAPADMVALVQTAMMLPRMIVSVPAGAIADMFDRRKIALLGLALSALFSALLTALAMMGLTTPWVLLAFCVLIGGGVTLYSPAWGASISEQVEPEQLPAAVALGSISYNVARSFGPAVGGAIVAAAGAFAAFATNALAYLPLLVAFFLWRRAQAVPRLPPERIDRAIISGTRYALHSSPVRTVMVRACAFGLASAAAAALAPLVARDLLHGDASVYGLLLGCSGVGAVVGALLVGKARVLLQAEHAFALCAITGGLMTLLVGVSHNLVLTGAALIVVGIASMLAISLLNVNVQMSVPRWVAARALAWYQAALTGGIALGAWISGRLALDWGVDGAFFVSGAVLMLTPLIGLVTPMRRESVRDIETVELEFEPEVALAITARSGPIVIELDYHVDPDEARQFYAVMLKLQRPRLRNGAFNWSLSRDIADPSLWTERFHFPTWEDYLRHRSRFTHADQELQAAANAFSAKSGNARIRRRLERPFGSVRWRAETPDPQGDSVNIYTP